MRVYSEEVVEDICELFKKDLIENMRGHIKAGWLTTKGRTHIGDAVAEEELCRLMSEQIVEMMK